MQEQSDGGSGVSSGGVQGHDFSARPSLQAHRGKSIRFFFFQVIEYKKHSRFSFSPFFYCIFFICIYVFLSPKCSIPLFFSSHSVLPTTAHSCWLCCGDCSTERCASFSGRHWAVRRLRSPALCSAKKVGVMFCYYFYFVGLNKSGVAESGTISQ